MNVQTLIADIAVDRDLPATDLVSIANNDKRVTGMYQVSGITTATVDLFGRTSPDMAWQLVKTTTANIGVVVDLWPQMYARITGWSAGTIRAELAS